MKVEFVVLVGILGIILFCSDSEAKPSKKPPEIEAKYRRKIACYFKNRHCSREDVYFKSQFPEILGNGCLKCDAKTKRRARKEIPIIKKHYTAKFRILLDTYVVPKVYNCLVHDGPCDKKMTLFKEYLPFMLNEKKCSDCSEEVKSKVDSRISFLKQYHPKQWEEIEKKYRH